MAASSTQVSAIISVETKKLLDRYVRSHGVKKGFLIESALLHHLAALDALPGDVIVPPRLVITRASGEKVVESIARPAPATDAMKELFHDE